MTERILYFDLVGGAAGDMVLAALLDLGASLDTVKAAWAKVGLDRVTAKVVPVDPAGLRALSLDVFVDGQLADADVPEGSSMAVAPPHEHDADHRHAHHDHGHAHHDHDDSHAHHGHRPYAAIRALLAEADLPKPVIDRAQDAFWRLAEAEGKAHGIDPAEVVFHEVGSDDAIADILGVATAWHELAIDRVVVSPFPLGHGLTRGGHGPIPLPGPATLHLLEGAPTVGVPLNGETVTPTGAAVLTSLADAYGLSPA
ncbi:MAG: LarC family nickel insertion protein, partial [Myxococcota bacterium]